MSVGSPLGAAPRPAGYDLPQGHLGAERVSSRRAVVALAGLLFSGLVIAVAAASTPALLPDSVRLAVPSHLAAHLGAGIDLNVGGTIFALALMTCCYVAVVSLSDQFSARAILTVIAALHAFFLLAPPIVSTDVFSYQAYARMGAIYATNPYVNGPHAIALDQVFPYIGSRWSYIPSVYGPVFTTFSYLLAPLSIAASVFAYKSIAALASLGLVAVVWHCARLRDVDPVRAVALVGLNPLLLIYAVGGGHNDLMTLLVLTGAIWAVLSSRERLGGALAMLATGIKLSAGVVAPFAIAAGGPGRERGRRRDLLIGVAAGLALVLGLTSVAFGSSTLQMFATLRKSQTEGSWLAIPGGLSNRLDLPLLGHAAPYLLGGAFVIACCWLLVRVWRGLLDWIDGAAWATIAMLLASSSLLPWYVPWALPLAALGRDRRLVRVALLLTAFVQGMQLLGYVPKSGRLL